MTGRQHTGNVNRPDASSVVGAWSPRWSGIYDVNAEQLRICYGPGETERAHSRLKLILAAPTGELGR